MPFSVSGPFAGVIIDRWDRRRVLVIASLTRAAPWLTPVPYELWLVAHRELRTSRRVRFVFDKMLAALG